MLYTPLAIDM